MTEINPKYVDGEPVCAAYCEDDRYCPYHESGSCNHDKVDEIDMWGIKSCLPAIWRAFYNSLSDSGIKWLPDEEEEKSYPNCGLKFHGENPVFSDMHWGNKK